MLSLKLPMFLAPAVTFIELCTTWCSCDHINCKSASETIHHDDDMMILSSSIPAYTPVWMGSQLI